MSGQALLWQELAIAWFVEGKPPFIAAWLALYDICALTSFHQPEASACSAMPGVPIVTCSKDLLDVAPFGEVGTWFVRSVRHAGWSVGKRLK